MATSDADHPLSSTARAYLRLQLAGDVGPVRVRNLVNHFGSIQAVLSTSVAQLQRVDQVGPKVAEAVFRARDDGAVDQEIARAAACGLRIICCEDAEYPRALLHTPDPPICLYVRGTLEPTDGVAVGVVGTRRCSHYGREQATRFGELLAGAGFTVVSGLARGIDSCAHRGALRAGGRTIAVLGNGLCSVYPPEHTELADEITRSGALLTEVPVDAAPDAGNFPRRNRVIVGLSLGVVVIEAGKRSGALITARLASEYNREVFALPGRVDQPGTTEGVNGLIRDGRAKLITCLDDVLDELADVGRMMRPTPAGNTRPSTPPDTAQPDEPSVDDSLAPHDRAVLRAVMDGVDRPAHIAEITELETARVMASLTALQLRGRIRRLPGDRFAPRSTDARKGAAD